MKKTILLTVCLLSGHAYVVGNDLESSDAYVLQELNELTKDQHSETSVGNTEQQIMPGGCYGPKRERGPILVPESKIPLFDRCTTPVGIMLAIFLIFKVFN